MKQYWQKLALKIDVLSLRERGIIFIAAAFALVSIINSLVLEPQFARQKQLSQQIKQDQAKMLVMQADMLQKIQARAVDPDVAERARLQQLRQQVAQLNASLAEMQKGLVPPGKMAALLQDILKRDASLRLISLKTLPVAGIADTVNALESAAKPETVAGAASPAAATVAVPLSALIYRHGVEIIVQGSYLDMLRYVAQLEAMPMQVFWGKARLQVDEHPQVTLTLTLYTLSLDKKWLNL